MRRQIHSQQHSWEQKYQAVAVLHLLRLPEGSTVALILDVLRRDILCLRAPRENVNIF